MKTLFKEKQKMTQWWVWVAIIFINGLYIWAVIQQLVLEQPFGNNPASDEMLIWFCFAPILITGMILMITMTTIIDQDGIKYRYIPFINRFKTIEWHEIEKVYVREYKPVWEYGGWGIRYSMKRGAGKAINVRGKIGIQIELKTGKKILLGTRKGEKVEKALAQFEK